MSFTQKTDNLGQLWESKLQEASEKESYNKLVKSIRSSKTIEQLKTAKKMAKNYMRMYQNKSKGDIISSKGKKEFEKWDEVKDIIKDQEERLKHLKNQ